MLCTEKTMERFRKRIDLKLLKKKVLFEMYIKTKLYGAQNIWQ